MTDTIVSPCPGDHTLSALIEHALTGDAAARVTSHLDDCVACRQVVVAAVRGESRGIEVETGAPTEFGFGAARGTQLAPGARIGRYQVRELLGVGGMGQVYEAYDDALDRAIALKVMRPELAGAASGLAERLRRESRIMAKVVHPAVIAVHDVGQAGDAVYIAMELVRGCTLGAQLARGGMSWRAIAAMFERAGQGLAAAHRAGVVHRDFKPENVLVEDGSGRVIVTDFGIARTAGTDTDPDTATETETETETETGEGARLTAPGVAMGTPAYMAPEQLDGADVDERADVFAFCVSLWEAWFGMRPFPGDSARTIRAAMARAPQRPARTAVPRQLVRVVERGLAIDPAARWATLAPVLAALAPRPGRARRIAIGVGALVLVGAGAAAAPLLAAHPVDDPCARALATVARADDPAARAALGTALANAPAARAVATARVELTAAGWRATELATCHADRTPAQDPNVTACLDARRLELLGYVDDVIADGAAAAPYATRHTGTLGTPWPCAHPAPGMLASRVPADPALRRAVTALRFRGYDVEAERGRGEFPTALAGATALLRDGASLWPPMHAELLYLLGGTQSEGGSDKDAAATLRQAAAVAEAVHNDYIAANSWILLVELTTGVDADSTRALEYATYADAAVARLGRPPETDARLSYVTGAALADAHRQPEAEAAFRHAIDLGETLAPAMLPQAIHGLGYIYEDEGRFAEAAAAYRRALAVLDPSSAEYAASAGAFRQRLAETLATLGHDVEAEAVAREAVALADRATQAGNSDRVFAHAALAQVLQVAGKSAEALIEAHATTLAIAATDGVHSERYGEALLLEGTVLADLRRDREAVPMFTRACELVGFDSREPTAREAECWTLATPALIRTGRGRDALAHVDRALPILIATYGDRHPEVAIALFMRGGLHASAGRRTLAIADLARAVDLFAPAQLDPGFVGASQWALGHALWPVDRARATGLITDAIEHLETSAGMWAPYRQDAAEWLASDGHPRAPPKTF